MTHRTTRVQGVVGGRLHKGASAPRDGQSAGRKPRKRRPGRRTPSRDRSPQLDPTIFALAREVVKLRKHAEALGIFTNDRELLECPKCGLMEDVTIDGILITYRGHRVRPRDSGLRFERIDDDSFRCPSCRQRVKAVIL